MIWIYTQKFIFEKIPAIGYACIKEGYPIKQVDKI